MGLGADVVAGLPAGVEFFHLEHGELGHGVVDWFVVVDFVDWDGGVHDLGHYGLFVDDWLHGFVDVVVDMFADNGW